MSVSDQFQHLLNEAIDEVAREVLPNGDRPARAAVRRVMLTPTLRQRAVATARERMRTSIERA